MIARSRSAARLRVSLLLDGIGGISLCKRSRERGGIQTREEGELSLFINDVAFW